jgi:hypothetical protein
MPASWTGSTLLIQFAREPVEGAVKTRLIGALSPRQACQLHCELVQWTCNTLLAAELGDVELSVAGSTGHPLFAALLEQGVRGITRQRGADLGERMYNAMVDGLARYERVLLVGSDCPAIDAVYLEQALLELDGVPVVVGPALDGGYVLIGARQVEPGLFSGISWGGDRVYAQTLLRLQALGLRWAELPVLADIDRPADLVHWPGR